MRFTEKAMIDVYKQTAIMLLYIVIGAVLKKLKFPQRAENALSQILLKALVPCAIISSFINNSFEFPVGKMFMLLGSGCAAFAVMAIAGKITALPFCKDRGSKGVWEFAIMFSNNIFIGFPVIRHFFGAEGMIYATLFCIPSNALMFSYGIYLSSAGNGFKFSIKKILNPSVMASVLALALLNVKIQIPAAAELSVGFLGKMSSPLGLIILGFCLAEHFRLKNVRIGRSLYFSLIRLFVLPLVTGVLYMLFWRQDVMMMQVMILNAALPSASMGVILSKQYGNPAIDLSIETVALSTVIFLVAAPGTTALLLSLFT